MSLIWRNYSIWPLLLCIIVKEGFSKRNWEVLRETRRRKLHCIFQPLPAHRKGSHMDDFAEIMHKCLCSVKLIPQAKRKQAGCSIYIHTVCFLIALGVHRAVSVFSWYIPLRISYWVNSQTPDLTQCLLKCELFWLWIGLREQQAYQVTHDSMYTNCIVFSVPWENKHAFCSALPKSFSVIAVWW